MANQNKLQATIRNEMMAQNNGSRFGITPTSNHAHTGFDSPQISQNNILPGNSVEGTITFAAQDTYFIGVNFNPVKIDVHGVVTGFSSGEKFMVVGNAKLGPSLYLQPNNIRSVIPGGIPQSIIQSTTYCGTDVAGTFHTLVDEEHIVDVTYGGTINARATITAYNNKNIVVQVDNLTPGWNIILSFTIT